jgi:L-ascorbate metabolism protein UlaG (beta-lactamase superfamily)
MIIHHIRNATFVIESGQHHILIDPMLSGKQTCPPFARWRHRPRKNPLVALPEKTPGLLSRVTHCLITHSQKFGIKALQHIDHLDAQGEAFLRMNNIPVTTGSKDIPYLKKWGLNVVTGLQFWQPEPFLDGKITAIPTQHGHGWIHYLMANGAGFMLQLPGEPSIYISGDTVYNQHVDRALRELKPEVAIMASGGAGLDIGKPILMSLNELMTFVRNAPHKVIANHLEALNHCPTTRKQLKQELHKNNLHEKVFVPDDGESLSFIN